jgi:hypothetical protein
LNSEIVVAAVYADLVEAVFDLFRGALYSTLGPPPGEFDPPEPYDPGRVVS